MWLRHSMRGAKFQFFLFPTPHFFNTQKKQYLLTTQRDSEKRKCSRFSRPRLSFGTWRPPIPLRFGDEGERQPHRGHDACGITACW